MTSPETTVADLEAPYCTACRRTLMSSGCRNMRPSMEEVKFLSPSRVLSCGRTLYSVRSFINRDFCSIKENLSPRQRRGPAEKGRLWNTRGCFSWRNRSGLKSSASPQTSGCLLMAAMCSAIPVPFGRNTPSSSVSWAACRV